LEPGTGEALALQQVMTAQLLQLLACSDAAVQLQVG
jgi:hypothetical protein